MTTIVESYYAWNMVIRQAESLAPTGNQPLRLALQEARIKSLNRCLLHQDRSLSDLRGLQVIEIVVRLSLSGSR